MKLNNVNSALKKIKSREFDENDIKALLIDIRESLNEDSALKDIAHSIAHDCRDKGRFYDLLLLNYLKTLMLIDCKRITQLFYTDGVSRNMVSALNRLIDRISNASKMNKAKNFFNANLQKIDNAKINSHVNDSLLLSNIEIITSSVELHLNTETIIKELEEFAAKFERVFSKAKTKEHYNWFIRKYGDEIIVCILSILHDVKFKLKDNLEIKFNLSMNEGSEKQIHQLENNRLKICIEFETELFNNLAIPILESNIKALHYIDDFFIGFIDPLEHYHASRIPDGSLRLLHDKSITGSKIMGHVSVSHNETNFNFLSLQERKKIIDSEIYKGFAGTIKQLLDKARIYFEDKEYESCLLTCADLVEYPEAELNRLWWYVLSSLELKKSVDTEYKLLEEKFPDQTRAQLLLLHIDVENKKSNVYKRITKLLSLNLSSVEFLIMTSCLTKFVNKEIIDLLTPYINVFDNQTLKQFGYLCLAAKNYPLALRVLSTSYEQDNLSAEICLNLAEAHYFLGNKVRFLWLLNRAKIFDENIEDKLDLEIKKDIEKK